MIAIKDFIKGPAGFPSLLNCIAFVDEGIMLNKDGSLSTSFYYSGPDLDSSTVEQCEAISNHINVVLSKLGSGWTLHIDSIRLNAIEYPDDTFPEATTQLIDNERKRNYRQEGAHFETIYALTLTYVPSLIQSDLVQKILVSGKEQNKRDGFQYIKETFKQKVFEIESGLSTYLQICQMNSQEMLSFLHTCITGQRITVPVPDPPMYINHIIGGYDFIAGIKPKIDGKYIGAVSLMQFPFESNGKVLDILSRLPFKYRFSSRFIFKDPYEAEKIIGTISAKYASSNINVGEILREMISSNSTIKAVRDSDNKAADADEAVTEAQENLVKFGFYTGVCIIINENREECAEQLNLIRKVLDNSSFPARVEGLNAVEAYLGSIPSHTYQNIRKPIIHTYNLVHLLPLTDIWPGEEYNPCPYFPPKSSPIFYAATQGATPFRFNLHNSDIGHCAIIGPTGSGKSTILSLIIAQYSRYLNAQGFIFDKKQTQYIFAKAIGADHYNILGDNSTGLCPLTNIDSKSNQIWAADWVNTLLELQGVSLTPRIHNDVEDAIRALIGDKKRTLSNLYMNIQNKKIKEALEPFVTTCNGMMSELLDAQKDGLSDNAVHVFEMENLMNKAPRYSIPVLMYLFHRIEERLDGRPTFLILDEAWLVINNEIFVDKLGEWLRTLRDKNAAVIFATQSIKDLIDSPLRGIILESCQTKIFLPNPGAGSQNARPFYELCDLNDQEISIIANAIPKQQYYFKSLVGQRLIELGLGSVALSMFGNNTPKSREIVKSLEKEFPQNWQAHWLRKNGLNDAANEWEELNLRKS